MTLDKRYDPGQIEPRLQSLWEELGIYKFSRRSRKEVFSIDTPPPTVSGQLHLGHVYSYSQTDFIARYRRMRGDNVFYPMGYDDNGLPTDRLVEKRYGIRASEADHTEFIEKCLQVSEESEAEYEALWRRMGLSIDWRFTYRTIDERSQRISQYSFLDLYQKNLVYQRDAPTIWCPECQTAIAQAELNEMEREGKFFTIEFQMEKGDVLPIATTRPELLPACVAVFVNPKDHRYQELVGMSATVPIFGHKVSVFLDPAVDPEVGTGAVMCCTFGDITDVAWWYTYNLDLVELFSKEGTLTKAGGEFAGLTITQARKAIINTLEGEGKILATYPTLQSIRVHERCDTPVEFIITQQWFIHILDKQNPLLQAGDHIDWHPDHMKARYRAWVENLKWDWCISRQRYFGVHFPLWYCKVCNEILLAHESQLPVDPGVDKPLEKCPKCGSQDFMPEEDVFDTWMTSSMSPQIAGGWQDDPDLYELVFPYSLRPQAHEIIRTWAFYTIYKSIYHFDQLPWWNVVISGWGIAGEGMGKISKSRGGGPMPPMEMIDRYSADAVRFWSASTSLGKDSIISEEKIQIGSRLLTKIWNVARFSENFLKDYSQTESLPPLSPADRWILSRLQKLVQRSTELFDRYDYATAKSEIEMFFWTELADNYLEMCKQRLYERSSNSFAGAQFALYHVLLTTVKLFAPIMPYLTDEIYQNIFSSHEHEQSIHVSNWPSVIEDLVNEQAEDLGEILVEIAIFVRRYKSENNLPLGTELSQLILATEDESLANALTEASADIKSITRAEALDVHSNAGSEYIPLSAGSPVAIFIKN